MKSLSKLLVISCGALLISAAGAFAQYGGSSGLCRANLANPHFAQLCRQFDNQKDSCIMNQRTCDWTSTSSVGYCTNNSANPHFAMLCKQLRDADSCRLNERTCSWIETD